MQFLCHALLIILHIVIWYINDNFTQSLPLSFVTSNKLDLLVYLLENVSQIKFIVDKQFATFRKVYFLSELDSTFYSLQYRFCILVHGVLDMSAWFTDVLFINHEYPPPPLKATL